VTATAEILDRLGDADRAARSGDVTAARDAFVEAGACAAIHGRWRAAVRCYRRALELDLLDREIVAKIVRIAGKVTNAADWASYARVLEARPPWPSFGCRSAQIVVGDLGGVVTCAGIGAVLEVMMAHDDLIDVHPDGQLAGMPLAMAMVILRRALWPVPRDHATDPARVRVTFAAGRHVQLDEHGDWQPRRDQ